MPGERAAQVIREIGEARQALARQVASLEDAEHRPAGDNWTVKEMVAHVAFWEEAPYGVIYGMFRKTEMPEGWRFGSGWMPENEWPHFDVHNAREAAWAREQTMDAVLKRWDRAHAALIELLETVTDDEVETNAWYFKEMVEHIPEHVRDLEQAIMDEGRAN